MAYDYSKLSGKIVEKFGTQGKFADAMGMSEHTMSQKLTCKRAFKQPEISLACELLDIADEEIHPYFFAIKVQ